MAVKPERPPRRRAWWPRFAVAGVLLVAVAGLCGWWFVMGPLLETRRPFVGTWRLESPVLPGRPEVAVEIDLMIDGTVRDRLLDTRTGVVEHEELRPGRWWVTGGRFQVSVDAPPLLGRPDRGRLGWDHGVIWEGPDRLRLENSSASRPTMVWVRRDQGK